MRRIIQTALCLVVLSLSMMATELKITFNSEAKTITTKKFTEVHYYSEHFHLARKEKDQQDDLIDYKDFTVYSIDHKKKVIQKIALDDLQEAMKIMSGAKTEDGRDVREAMDKMFGGEDGGGKVSVDKIGTEVIVGKNCTKWKVSMGKNVFEISADPNLVPPTPQTSLERASQLKGAVFAMLSSHLPKLYQEMSKIKGIPLKSQRQIAIGPMTIKSTSQAISIEEGPIPASVFELPKGYKMEDAGKKMLEEVKKKMKQKTVSSK